MESGMRNCVNFVLEGGAGVATVGGGTGDFLATETGGRESGTRKV